MRYEGRAGEYLQGKEYIGGAINHSCLEENANGVQE